MEDGGWWMVDAIQETTNERLNNGLKKQKRTKIVNLALLLITIISFLLIFELTLNLFFPQRLYNECFSNQHPDSGGPVIEKNESYGWYNKKDYHVCRYQPDTNKKIDIHHNSRGLRSNYEHSYEKPEGITRVLLLGDSNTHGFGLAQNETEAYLLQEKLGNNYEVINLGVIGYGIDQSLSLFVMEGSKYDPDIIVLNIFSNDFSDAIQLRGIDGLEKPIINVEGQQGIHFFNLSSETLDREDYFFDKPIRRFLKGNFNSYALISERLANTLNGIASRKAERTNFTALTAIVETKNSGFFWAKTNAKPFEDYPAHTQEDLVNNASARISSEISALQAHSQFNGVGFIVTYTPSKKEVYPKEQEKFVNQFWDVTIDNFDFEKSNQILTEMAINNNFNFVSYHNVALDNRNFYFKTDGHKSPGGAKITAEILASVIKTIEKQSI